MLITSLRSRILSSSSLFMLVIIGLLGMCIVSMASWHHFLICFLWSFSRRFLAVSDAAFAISVTLYFAHSAFARLACSCFASFIDLVCGTAVFVIIYAYVGFKRFFSLFRSFDIYSN